MKARRRVPRPISILADALDGGGWTWLASWLPASLPPDWDTTSSRRFGRVTGRLRPGTPLERARERLAPWRAGDWANLQAVRGDHRLACDFWCPSPPGARCRVLAGMVAEHPHGALARLMAGTWPRPTAEQFRELLDFTEVDRGRPPPYTVDPRRWGTGFFAMRVDDPRRLAYLARLPAPRLHAWLRNYGPFTLRLNDDPPPG